ncbi:MAG TPA: HAMP domain-containing sensor histidine kinase [Phycisphaerae bacterium]|nr:HAMP domain-containing sensor histidine kinase [Phycisphaerae bacterium]HNU44019.1 HAMP domain-containing sensor histidine kinase [Phycisphaerae bacterium]
MVDGPGPSAVAATSPLSDGQEPYRTGALLSLLRLHWFIRLRWALLFTAMAVLMVERFIWPTSVRPGALLAVLLVLAAVNLWWLSISNELWKRTRAVEVVEPHLIRKALAFANAQVAVDLLALTAILRYTGGVENPMAIFYLFHVAIGALVLTRWQAIIQAAWAVLLYTGMGVAVLRGWLKPLFAFLPALPPLGLQERPEYVLAAIGVLACGVFGTLYFTLKIAERFDEHEHLLRAANEALLNSEMAIRELQRRRSRFMQTAAHQLKSPLAGIQTLAGLIRDGIVPEAGVRPTCERIIRRCADGITQVAELLTLARIQEADPRRNRTASVDVVEVIRDVCERNRPQAKAKQITLAAQVGEGSDEATGEPATEAEGHGLRVWLDRADLVDCLGNLIENAIKYTPGPGKVTVTATRCPTPQVPPARFRAPGRSLDTPEPPYYVQISVADTGMGIEPDALAGDEEPTGPGTIFEAFRRGNQALAAGIPGTGLGLSIVREVVEQAGGRLRVQSKPQEGSTFTVWFPADVRTGARRATLSSAGPAAGFHTQVPFEPPPSRG